MLVVADELLTQEELYAVRRGFEARQDGLCEDSNPYVGGELAALWVDGWMYADDMCER